ncbi:MAG: ComEC/Rec2 family competence protein [Phycisphaerales bacterium]
MDDHRGLTHAQAARGRALTALCAAIVGVVISGHLPTGLSNPVLWFSTGCALAGGAVALGPRLRPAAFALCVLAMAIGWTQLRTSAAGTDRLDLVVGEIDARRARVPIEVRGVLIEPPRTQRRMPGLADPPMWPDSQTVARIRIESVYAVDPGGRGSWTPASGDARLIVPDGIGLSAGRRITVLGLYSPPPGARNIGEPDWGAMGVQSGRVGTIVVGDAAQISVLAHDGLLPGVKAKLLELRSLIRTRGLAAIGLAGDAEQANPGGAMLGALLLGQREPVFAGVYDAFQRVGVAHVLAISGFHLALVILLAVFAIRAIGEHPRVETAIIATVLVLMVLVIPMRPPIVRAAVIVASLLIAGRFGRRYDRMTVLAWVGVGLLIWRPLDAMGLGYQLSMGVTGLLVMLSHTQKHAVLNRHSFTIGGVDKPRGLMARWSRWIRNLAATNLACWLVAMPAILYHAGLVSLLAPLASMALVPMVMVLMVAGYLQVALGVIAPEPAASTAGAVGWIAEGVLGFIGWVDSLPGSSVRMHRISALWALIATALAAAVAIRPAKLRSPAMIAACMLVIGWVFVEPLIWRDRGGVRIDMMDVGDGSCLIVHSGGHGLVWDCGSLDRRVGRQAADMARALGITRLEDAIVTHDNLDHFNGLVELAERTGLERVWITPRLMDDPSPGWERIAGALSERGIQIRTIAMGDTLEIGGARLEILWPDPARTVGLDDNDTSLVARVTRIGDRRPSVLLTGDIEGPAMEIISDMHPDLRADVLELPHHGSARDRAYGWVAGVDPAVVLQSTGASRLDDERWDGVRPGRAWYTTAARGGVWARIRADGRIEHGWAVGE